MLKIKFSNKEYMALNVYNEETYINGVSRPSLSIEIDGESVDIAEIYGEFENIKNTGSVIVSNDFAEDTFTGYVLPLSFKVDYKEIERETLTTVQVLQKVITLVIATKTAAELKADPSTDLLAISSAEILGLRKQVKTLEDLLQSASIDILV